uniref:CRAL-TRIO domain-containing protein n=1 Tax=viral metagenome TaxID=1070528 RepID=A0A6C0L7X5_9ZZZZ
MNTESQIDFSKRIEELTNQYYSDNKKNTFFKSSQKMDCAAQVTNQIGIDELIQRTVYLIPNSDSVFMDYTVFKRYATPENYPKIVGYILSLLNYCISKYGHYCAHVNLDTFTISAAERHKTAIECFLTNCMRPDCQYSLKLKNMNIYNTPNTFNNISKVLMPFVDPVVREKIVLYDKKCSSELLNNLMKN